MPVRAALGPEIELIDVGGHEVNIIDLALESSQVIALQQVVVDPFFEVVLVVVEIVLDVVGVGLVGLGQQLRGDNPLTVMLNRY